LERTCAVYVQVRGGAGRRPGDRPDAEIQPLTGSPSTIADELRTYAGMGISHVQLVMDPITVGSITEFAPVLEELDRG
jgi:alkanesulfonate monooxygenase SsuD/methylene tetrahydromethanopterin reductase-like flavin-dependent oxidoreductase (luciferase family)